MASRAQVLEALESAGVLFTNELLVATGASRELVRLMERDGLLVKLTGTRGRNQQAWASAAHLRRVLRER